MANNTLGKNIADTIQYLDDIKQALKDKGQTMTNVPVSQYAGKIDNYTTDATATANDILYNKTAYVNGEKVTGSITVQYEQNPSSLSKYTINQMGTIAALTRDKKGVVIWNGTAISTYVFNETTNKYEYRNTYTESSLGIVDREGVSFTPIMDISPYVENNICYVAFFKYKLNVQVVTFNVQTGQLGYNQNGYAGTRGWYTNDSSQGTSSSSSAFAVHLEPIFDLSFSKTNPSILFLAMNNGYGYYKAGWVNVSKTGLGFGGIWDKSRNTAYTTILTTEDTRHIFINDTLYTIDTAQTSRSEANTSLGTNVSINTNNTLCVAGGKLYNLTLGGTVFQRGNEIPLSITLPTTRGVWLSDKIYLAKTNEGIMSYNFTDISNVQVEQYGGTNLNIKQTGKPISTSSTTTDTYIYYITDAEQYISSLYLPSESAEYYNGSRTTVEPTNVLSGKTFIGSSGKSIGTMQNNGALNYIPATTQQSIPSGYTSGGTIAAINNQTKNVTPTTSQQTITFDTGYNGLSQVTVNAVTSSIDTNIQAENIKKDIEILGVTGTLEEGIDTSDATATASDISQGKTAYVNGEKITGTATGTGDIILDVGNNNVSVSGTTLIFEGGSE